MNIAQIEENVKALIAGLASGTCSQEDFIYELLLAYGHRKQSVSRLRSGERNLASKGNEFNHCEIVWKRHLYFKQVESGELLAEIDQMRKEKLVAAYKIRFVIVTDFDQLFAHDLKTNDRLDISLNELPNKFDFFLPWAGMEKAVYQGENPADVKAAEKMAKLFDLIKGDNFDESNKDDTEALHGLNVFLTRLLFCFFAEDTEIFADNQFSNAIQSHTKDDGSDLSNYLNRLFTVLNTSGSDRGELPDYLSDFPYVNGGLFATDIFSPSFTAKSRRMLIECGSELDWSDINPDIFGSMIQAVVHSDQRSGMGMHYTSVTNIMKVIEPLFLNDLYEELEKVESNETKLQKLQQRIGEIKVFDPACGSGNFLIIAYKELRKLEMEVLKHLQELELEKTGQISQPFSVIKLSQFYGIELDDFAHEVAILSLWLAEHQMNVEFKTEFGEVLPSLPLKKSGHIVCGNAALMAWDKVCDSDGGEVFIMGNPPYLGARNQSKDQKEDMRYVFKGIKSVNSLDYISCWIFKASSYISEYGGASGFVSTNSVVQGEHVPLLWPHVLTKGVEIAFAEEPFKWSNSAKNKAAVICVVVGLSKNPIKKSLIKDGYTHSVSNISPYLTDNDTIFIDKRSKPLSCIPKMEYGNQPIEGGFLKLDTKEKDDLIYNHPETLKFIKRLIGGSEFKRIGALVYMDRGRRTGRSLSYSSS
jgi:type II restriction/modification system DNA methylase subunit YeeA